MWGAGCWGCGEDLLLDGADARGGDADLVGERALGLLRRRQPRREHALHLCHQPLSAILRRAHRTLHPPTAPPGSAIAREDALHLSKSVSVRGASERCCGLYEARQNGSVVSICTARVWLGVLRRGEPRREHPLHRRHPPRRQRRPVVFDHLRLTGAAIVANTRVTCLSVHARRVSVPRRAYHTRASHCRAECVSAA